MSDAATGCRHKIIHGDGLEFIKTTGGYFDTVFLDPPDNIGLKYDGHKDKMDDYFGWLDDMIFYAIHAAEMLWLSFNSKHTLEVAHIVRERQWECLPCIQTFTFGQHNQKDLGNSYRQLWRLSGDKRQLYPDAIRVQSWRQKNGDKRADPRGRVPNDVFDFPRVTGNSKQRRAWHPTQLHEGLVERCLKLTTPPGGTVLDPCAGTGTTLRVCKRLGFECTLVEKSETYYKKLMEEHGV